MTAKKDTASETPAEFTLDNEEMEDQVAENSKEMELKLLKERADQMGLNYHPSIGVDTLRAKIAAVLNAEPEPKENQDTNTMPDVIETSFQKNERYRKDAMRLVRVIVTCMNPSKQSLDGEYFTAGNSVVGTVRKYVHFNNENGWHIPHIIYEQLLEKQYQAFYTVQDPRTRKKTRKGKLVNEFNITVLPPLTKEELQELASQQALNRSID